MLGRFGRILYRLLHLIALAFLLFAFAQALPFDLVAIVFAGDVLVYFEIAAAVWLAAQVTRVKWVAAYVRFVVHRRLRLVRIRARRIAKRLARPRDDDRPAPALAFA